MIDFERHITKLLLSNDCVIVPGFGGFMAHHMEARYDAESHLFYPPHRTLGFNPQLTMNDSLLVQSFIEVYDISYPEALTRIEENVNELVDLDGIRHDFLIINGFDVDGVDYNKEVTDMSKIEY